MFQDGVRLSCKHQPVVTFTRYTIGFERGHGLHRSGLDTIRRVNVRFAHFQMEDVFSPAFPRAGFLEHIHNDERFDIFSARQPFTPPCSRDIR